MAGTAVDQPAHILAVAAPTADPTATASPLEAYLRGPDLIATYGPTNDHPFRYQVYWRAVSARYPDALSAIELVVSIQTHLLDSRPQMTICSLLPVTAGWRWASASHAGLRIDDIACPPPDERQFGPTDGIGCFRFRLAGGRLDYAEMVHPVDFRSSSLTAQSMSSAAPATRLSHRLFSGELEKGVILRSRVLSLFLPTGAASETIARYYRSFVEEELPLTT